MVAKHIRMILKVLVQKNGPSFLERSLVDQIITVSDKDGFDNVKRLAQQEGLLVGSSSGAALQGALDIKNQIDKGVIVTIFPDGSDRYMSKKYLNTKRRIMMKKKHK